MPTRFRLAFALVLLVGTVACGGAEPVFTPPDGEDPTEGPPEAPVRPLFFILADGGGADDAPALFIGFDPRVGRALELARLDGRRGTGLGTAFGAMMVGFEDGPSVERFTQDGEVSRTFQVPGGEVPTGVVQASQGGLLWVITDSRAVYPLHFNNGWEEPFMIGPALGWEAAVGDFGGVMSLPDGVIVRLSRDFPAEVDTLDVDMEGCVNPGQLTSAGSATILLVCRGDGGQDGGLLWFRLDDGERVDFLPLEGRIGALDGPPDQQLASQEIAVGFFDFLVPRGNEIIRVDRRTREVTSIDQLPGPEAIGALGGWDLTNLVVAGRYDPADPDAPGFFGVYDIRGPLEVRRFAEGVVGPFRLVDP